MVQIPYAISILLLTLLVASRMDLIAAKRIMFVSDDEGGHLQPIKRLARAMIARGKHEVVFATFGNPSGLTKETICGASHETCQYAFLTAGASPNGSDTSNGSGFIARLVGKQRAMLDSLLPALRNQSYTRPDLLVVESSAIAGYDIAVALAIPFVVFSSAPLPIVLSGASFRYNLYDMYSWLPIATVPISESLANTAVLHKRLLRFAFKWMWLTMARLVFLPAFNKVRKERELPSTSGSMIDSEPHGLPHPLFIFAEIPGLSPQRPLPANIHFVGPMVEANSVMMANSKHDRNDNPRNLPKVDNPRLYVAFGTQVVFSEGEVHNLAQALCSLSSSGITRVLWSLPDAQQAFLPSNISHCSKSKSFQIDSWVDQPAILADPSTKLFLTHGGANSIQEALFFGCPLLVMPRKNDHFLNAKRIVDIGAGRVTQASAQTIKASQLDNLVQEMLLDTNLEERVQRWSQIAKFAGGIERSLDLIDHVLEVGTDHLISREFAIPIWQLYNLDLLVVGVLLLWIFSWRFRLGLQKSRDRRKVKEL